MLIMYKMVTSGETSSQDGGVGRHASPPCTTIIRITTNLTTKNTQNCRKIELYGSPTTKDLKKTFVQVGSGGRDGELRQRVCSVMVARWQEGAAASEMGGPTFTCGG